ncbi:uncharacterized protein LOC122024241 [Zingiber officinale]|nr:uncharacterized protein LOC122024241 [Zingiber officinale]XP_042438747.1 uncharacterized protein LOC122024241 [Zingiber officinale]
MPTYTAIALERLLEPGSRVSAPKPPPVVPNTVEKTAQVSTVRKSIPRPNISPALYATPETTPLPDSPSSCTSESPYLINHKRRGPRLINRFQKNDAIDGQSKQSEVEQKVDVVKEMEYDIGNYEADGVETSEGKLQNQNLGTGETGAEDSRKPTLYNLERDEDTDDFFDMQSIASSSDFEDSCSRFRSSTPRGEFFDALEEISSDGTSPSPSSYNNLEAEFREMKLHLLMEIQKRTQAEESLQNLQDLWHRLSHQLSLLGFSLPLPPSISEDMNIEHSVDPVAELSQQIVVARCVADAVVRGSARAEVEMEMEPQIASKNFEITRLWDRLQYYEAANREMSHRNQEAVEMARQQRNRRKRRQKWFWGSICLAITITGAAITWSYVPSTEAIPSESKSSTIGEQE